MAITAVIFDLDGTITRPCLDFDQIRAEMGLPPGPILEAMQRMKTQERRHAEEILHQHELHAALNAQLNPGVHEVVDYCRQRQCPLALATRNRRDSVQRVCAKHDLAFDCVVTREDGPAKPDPFAVLHACRTFAVDPADTLVVGDYLFDLLAGRRAGARTVLLATSPNHRDFMQHADFVIASLTQLPKIMQDIQKEASQNTRPNDSQPPTAPC